MTKGTQPGVSSGVKGALVFLMFAVFVWGLHTKLSHYIPSMSSNSASATAKLVTDKSVEHSADSCTEDVANGIVERIEIPTFSAVYAVPLPQLALYQVELSLCSSCRYDSNGPNSMHLPPPTIS